MRFFRYRKSTEEKIKEATINLLAEKSYKDLSMRDIARKAGAAVGQLTYYYKKKENLLLEIADEIFTTYVNELTDKVNKSDEKLNAVLEFHEKFYAEDREMVRVLLNFTTESFWDNRLKEKFNYFSDNITGLIEKIYIDMGVENANAKASFFISSIYGAMAQNLLNNENKLNENMKVMLLKV